MNSTLEAVIPHLTRKQQKLAASERGRAILELASWIAANPTVRLPAATYATEAGRAAVELGRALPTPPKPGSQAELAAALNNLATALQNQKPPTVVLGAGSIQVRPEVNIDIPQRAVRVERDSNGRVIGAKPL
jgi:hypothetical protein